jgi:RNA polymerase sigma-70 factor (ECF subfamily)
MPGPVALRGVLPRVGGCGAGEADAGSAAGAGAGAGDKSVVSDAELVALAKRDRAAFAPLYQRYAPSVFRYCRRRLGDPEAAADATSQVFVRVLAALPRCRGETFRAWLVGIAHNVTTDALRASARRRLRDAPLEGARHRVDLAPSPEQLAVAGDGEAAVRALLAALPADQRAIVELRLAGLTGVEIAQALGKSHGAVRIAQLRAYRRLRELLGPGEPVELPDPRRPSAMEDRDAAS